MNTGPNEDEKTGDKKIQMLNAATRLLTVQGLQAYSFEGVADEAGLSGHAGCGGVFVLLREQMSPALTDGHKSAYLSRLSSLVITKNDAIKCLVGTTGEGVGV